MRYLFALFIAIISSGCASSGIAVIPQTLDEVYAILDGRWSTLELRDGRKIDWIEDVRITPSETSYVIRSSGDRSSVATDEVLTVAVLQKRGTAGRGALIGAAPGAFLVGLGLNLWLGRKRESAGSHQDLAAAIYLVSGAIALSAGALVGAIVGGSKDRGEEVIVYRAPLHRYIDGH